MVKNGSLICGIALALAACGGEQELLCMGPESLRGVTDTLGAAFSKQTSGVKVTVQSCGTSRALKRLADGRNELALAGRRLNALELARARENQVTVREHLIAHQGVALHVHPDNGIQALTVAEIVRIVGGDPPTRWSEFGVDLGPDHAVIHVVLQAPAGDAAGLLSLLGPDAPARAHDAVTVESGAEVLAFCARHADAIGLTGLAFPSGTARPVPVIGSAGVAVAPTAETCADASYALCQPIYLVEREDAGAAPNAFLAWVRNDPGRRILLAHGLLPARP